MWKKWAMAAIVYLFIVMAVYGVYSAISGPDTSPSQMEMK
jgi:hypothetical protein